MSAPSIKKMSIDGPGLFIVNSADMPMLETLVATTSITFNNQSVALKNLKLMDLSITSGSNVTNIDPFFTTKMGQGGTGLGLSISFNIVTSLLGGQLSVTSTLEKGSCFILDLPLQATAPPL